MYAPFVHTPTEAITPTLYRGMDPKVKDIQALHDKGFKSIISLRTNPQKKKARLCHELGMNWYVIKTGVFKVPTFEQMDEFRAIVNNPKNQPCYTSCEVNMDRTGVYIAAHRMVDLNWSAQQVADEFKAHHQKTWWPTFTKYQGAVEAYAAQRQSVASASRATPMSGTFTSSTTNVVTGKKVQ
jgi:hypothetical protein